MDRKAEHFGVYMKSLSRKARVLLILLLSTVGVVSLFGQAGGGGQGPRVQKFDDATLSFAYIPAQDFEIDGSIDFTLKSAADQDFFIVVDYGNNSGACGGNTFSRCAVNPNDAADTVRYELWNQDDIVIRDLPDATDSSEVIAGTVPGNPQGNNFANYSAAVSIFIEAGQLTNSTPDYTDTLSMRLYFGSIEDPTSYDPNNPEGEAILTVSGNVDPFVELALVEPGGNFPTGFAGDNPVTSREMAFGVLEAGDTREYELLVRSNALFSIDVSSNNGGFLVYQDGGATGGLPTEVGYELIVDGVPRDLSGGTVNIGTNLTGFRWPFLVQILEYGTPVAGNYQDVLNISVTAGS